MQRLNSPFFKSVRIGIVFLFFGWSMAKAQQSADTRKVKIIGRIVDSVTAKALEYAVINVYQKGNKKAISSTATDNKGNFSTDKLTAGDYYITITFVGYQTKTVNGLQLRNADIVLGNIIISSAATQTLQEVTVFSKAPVIENKIDKIVYNVANDVTSQGGVALDVLKKVPQVTVDIDGNIELQGNSSIRFLINGKPSSAFGNSIADALAAIPASQIKSIEAITSPGAKYDAEGTGGIINIILKDNKVKGINGTVNLSAGSRLENGSVNLNIRNNNFGINAFFSGNEQLNSRTLSSQDRYSIDTAGKTNTHLTQNGYSDFTRHGYQTGMGFDWSLTKKESITGSFTYLNFGNSGSGITNQEQLTSYFNNSLISDILTYRNATNSFTAGSVEWNLDYKKNFSKEKQQLEILTSSSYGTNVADYLQVQNYVGQSDPFTGSGSHNPGTDRQTNISVDYAHPLSEHFLLETGAKFIVQDIYSEAKVNTLNTATKQYAIDTTQSYHLNYDRKIYAGYVSASFSLFRYLNVKSGLRVEHTDTKIDYPNTTIPSYNSYAPSVILSHDINDKQTIKLAYTHRIERPDYREINPFKNLSDPYNITTGNPGLQPEIGNNIELGYSKSFEKGSNIYMALITRINTQDIKPYTNFYPTYKIGDSIYQNVSVATRENIGYELVNGIIVSSSIQLQEKLSMRWNIFVFNRHIVNNLNGADTVVNGLNERINLNLSYQLPRNLVIEAFANYNSAFNNIQGRQPQFFYYTFALRKQFWNKKASFGFTATNPFNEYVKQTGTVTTGFYSATTIREVPLRSFGISLLYKFGKLQFKKEKEKEENNNPVNPSEN